ncbi:hypothetical protein T01_16000 [Trichinella spiralis]|uniref:Uncharacterized protein n=1 Tax=Trichinella spiralis TaxID=6334 RepID=A0A0V1AP48_TRISP|nr:hypothetical protein T01_16000 [Trichinella spiralis]
MNGHATNRFLVFRESSWQRAKLLLFFRSQASSNKHIVRIDWPKDTLRGNLSNNQ